MFSVFIYSLLLQFRLLKGIIIIFFLKAMAENPNKPFLIDGFPRNEDNLLGWNNCMQDKCIVKGVLYFDCPEEVICFKSSTI